MKKYLTEFIGTFFLVLTIGMCVIEPGAGDLRHRIGAGMPRWRGGGHPHGSRHRDSRRGGIPRSESDDGRGRDDAESRRLLGG